MHLNLEQLYYEKQNLKKIIPSASAEALKVLKKMIKLDPRKRPSAKELLKEQIFKNAVQNY